MKVLIAEVDNVFRRLLVTLVNKHGYECIEACDGFDAWDKIQAEEPDIVISDWMMPGIDGTEICRRVRQRETRKYVYFILITSLADEEHLLQGFHAGVDDFVQKPIHREELGVRLIVAKRIHAVHEKLLDQQDRLAEMILATERAKSKVEQANIQLGAEIQERKRAEEEREVMHGKLLEASRQAGMMEVATDVLHNVGNTLNSVNVSATLAEEKVRRSKTRSLQKVAQLLSRHDHELAEFLSRDDRGRRLPGYISALADHLLEVQDEVLSEFKSIADNIAHIKHVVNEQRLYISETDVTESVPVAELVDRALALTLNLEERSRIEVVRELPELPPVIVDRQKLMQILVNLIRNAKQAIAAHEEGPQQLIVRSRMAGEDRVQIEIRDTGIGIEPEIVTRIFEHGFTTKEDSHGFSLHAGANAARQMGGSLICQSDGRGRGAGFILEIPLGP